MRGGAEQRARHGDVADVAHEFGAERFVLISTDKAVNPTRVMGATKRVAELARRDVGPGRVGTRFVAVRFGNVLGSAGSVIPIFRRQIARGGPVTVTHPEMTRYFMTIPEAVSLVLQAGAIGGRGERLRARHGRAGEDRRPRARHDPPVGPGAGRDIAHRVHRLRPGEKLYEELWASDEAVAPTKHPKIFSLTAPAGGRRLARRPAGRARAARRGRDTLGVVSKLTALVRQPQRVETRAPAAD